MTVISTGCPQCAGRLDFTRIDRASRVTARCAGCDAAYSLSPSGLTWIDGRALVEPVRTAVV